MNDQASALRQIILNKKLEGSADKAPSSGARVVCVTSGKGGVGKTSFALNLAISLAKKGQRVLIVDADFGLSNVDVMMGASPKLDLSHVISRKNSIKDVIFDAPGGIKFISGGSGVTELMNISETQISNILQDLLLLDDITDVIIFDTGAGVNQNILKIITSSDEVIFVTTPEPTAIMDAYALVKTVSRCDSDAKMRLVVNKAESAAEGEESINKFTGVVRLYLKMEIEALGYIISDPTVSKAVRLQHPLMLSFPKSGAARSIENIALKFLNIEPEPSARGGLRGFLNRLMRRK